MSDQTLKDVALRIVNKLANDYESLGHPVCPECGLCPDDGNPSHEVECLFNIFMKNRSKIEGVTDES